MRSGGGRIWEETTVCTLPTQSGGYVKLSHEHEKMSVDWSGTAAFSGAFFPLFF